MAWQDAVLLCFPPSTLCDKNLKSLAGGGAEQAPGRALCFFVTSWACGGGQSDFAGAVGSPPGILPILPPCNREGLPEREPFQFNHAPSARWCARHCVPAVLMCVAEGGARPDCSRPFGRS